MPYEFDLSAVSDGLEFKGEIAGGFVHHFIVVEIADVLLVHFLIHEAGRAQNDGFYFGAAAEEREVQSQQDGQENSVGNHSGREDAAAFLAWTQRFQELCRERNVIDSAVLPDAFAERVGALGQSNSQLPRQLLMAGFDIVPPQQHHVLRILREAGVAVEIVVPPPIQGKRVRIEFSTGGEELREHWGSVASGPGDPQP